MSLNVVLMKDSTIVTLVAKRSYTVCCVRRPIDWARASFHAKWLLWTWITMWKEGFEFVSSINLVFMVVICARKVCSSTFEVLIAFIKLFWSESLNHILSWRHKASYIICTIGLNNEIPICRFEFNLTRMQILMSGCLQFEYVPVCLYFLNRSIVSYYLLIISMCFLSGTEIISCSIKIWMWILVAQSVIKHFT